MTTYLVGTDGEAASDAVGGYLVGEVDEGDHIEAVNVLTDDDNRQKGEAALERLAAQFEGIGVTIETQQLARGRDPAEELLAHADEVDADHVVTALRRHSRTARIIFGSVSHSLLQRVSIPVTLVPLPEYQPSE